MSPDSNDLSPRLSIEDIGLSLSSLRFDEATENLDRNLNEMIVGLDGKRNRSFNFVTDIGSASPTSTTGTPTANTALLTIREEDLIQLSEFIDQALEGADMTLQGLEADRKLLPSAILRKCHEFADGLGSLAEELESKSIEDQTILADAIREDLRLFEEGLQSEDLNFRTASRLSFIPDSPSDGEKCTKEGNSNDNIINHSVGNQNQGHDNNDILRAISGASVLLRDIETAFREIGNDEAEEVADAALIMARLFLFTLRNIHTSLNGMLEASDSDKRRNNHDQGFSTVWIEELSFEDGEDEINHREKRPDGEQRQNKPRRSSQRHRRMRALWPPLGPKVDEAMAWTREEATKRPFLATVLGLTLWPVAITTALVGTSIALIDGAVQDAYEHFREGPWISVVEESTAQAYQVGRLTVATGKLVGKQSLRVVNRQIERRGGLQPIVQDLSGMALDRITHPIDTIGKVWDGIHWGIGVLKDATDDFVSMRQESQQQLM